MIPDAHDIAAAIDGMELHAGNRHHIVANRDLILSETAPRLSGTRATGRAGGRRQCKGLRGEGGLQLAGGAGEYL